MTVSTALSELRRETTIGDPVLDRGNPATSLSTSGTMLGLAEESQGCSSPMSEVKWRLEEHLTQVSASSTKFTPSFSKLGSASSMALPMRGNGPAISKWTSSSVAFGRLHHGTCVVNKCARRHNGRWGFQGTKETCTQLRTQFAAWAASYSCTEARRPLGSSSERTLLGLKFDPLSLPSRRRDLWCSP